VASLDVLRGVAILGILLMNIQSFSMIHAAYMNPTAYGDMTSWWNYAFWFFGYVFVEREFLELFAMLFGAGLVMMTARCDAAGLGSARMHYRRMVLLLVLGVLHAHLLWFGDILYAYAVCGMIVFLLRRRGPALLIVLGTLIIAVPSVLYGLLTVLIGFMDAETLQSFTENFKPPPELVAEEVAAYRGGWLEQMEFRTRTALFYQTWGFLGAASWRAAGSMCIGMALAKLDVFTAKRSSKAYLLMVVLGLLVGLPVLLYGVHANERVDWEATFSAATGMQYNYWGSLPVVFVWIGLVMLVCKHGVLLVLQRWLAAAGQLALSNYLLQTVICTTIFYGHGFGLFGKVERGVQFLIVLAVWVVQLALSSLWLRYFHFGPIEWLWRAVTYLEFPPMRRRLTAGEAAGV
jgi:uncharacterized protein